MFSRILKTVFGGVSALAATVFGLGVATAADPDMAPGGDHFILFTGIDAKEDSVFFYGGGIFAINGIDQNSLAIKGFIGGGDFDYTAQPSGVFPGGSVDGDSFTADVLGGYRAYFGGFQVGVYAGVNFQDITHSINVAGRPNVKARGDKAGFKIDAELNFSGQGPLYLDARGNYSTAFDTYWLRGRIGYNLGMFTIGPEGALLGNDDYDQARIGGFALFDLMDTGFSISLSAGYADVDGTTGQDSIYGSATVSTSF